MIACNSSMMDSRNFELYSTFEEENQLCNGCLATFWFSDALLFSCHQESCWS